MSCAHNAYPIPAWVMSHEQVSAHPASIACVVVKKPCWARAMLIRAAIGSRFLAMHAGQFSVLKPWLLGEVPSLSQAEAARELDLSEGAVKVAVHRMRKRFREVVKAQIAQTVDDPTQVREELRYLVDVLARQPCPPPAADFGGTSAALGPPSARHRSAGETVTEL